MKKENSNPGKPDLLRQKGEEKPNKKQPTNPEPLNEADASLLIQKLKARQIELEIQNEKLRLEVITAATATALYDFSPSGYFTLTRDGTICQLNLSGARILSKERNRLINKNFMRFVSHENLPLFQNFVQLVFESNSKQTCEVWLALKGIPSIFVHIEGLISEDKQKCLVTAVDITAHKHAEEALEFKNILLTTQQEASIDGILVVDENNTIVSYNRRFVEMLNIPQKLIENRSDEPVLRFVTELMVDPRQFVERIQYLYEHKQETSSEELILKNGKIFDRQSSPMFGSDERYYGRIWYFRDITDRKRVENILKQSELEFRTVWENSASGLRITNENGILFKVNDAFCKIFGKTKEELEGQPLSVTYAPSEKEHIIRRHQERFKSREVESGFEKELSIWNGKRIWVHIANSFIELEGEKPFLLGVFTDVTDRKKAELELLKEKNQLKIIFDTSPVSIWYKDTRNNFIRVNKAAAQIANRPVEEVEGHSADEMFSIESEKYYNDDLEVINSGKPKLGIIEPATANGVTTWLRTDKLPWYDADGNIAGIILFALDITDRIEAENKLRTSEARYRRLFESAKDGILILDAETGQIVDVNPFLFQLLGYSHDELMGKELWEIGVFKNIADSKDAFVELQNKGYIRFEDMPLETKDGKSINVEFVSNVYLVGPSKVIQCNIRDITKRKQAEEALRQSELRLRTLVQTIPDLIWLKDKDGIYLFCNTMFERFFGASEAEIVGKTDYDFMDCKLADSFREHDRRAMIVGKPTSNEEWITFADDGHRALLDTVKTPMYDSRGVLTGVLGISHDITERKEAEEIIQENEERFRKIFEEGPLGMVIVNSSMHFERANTAFCNMIGYSEQELRSLTFKEITHPDHLEADIKNIQKLFLGKISLYQTEKRYISKNNVIIWASLTTTAVRNANGDFMYFLSMIEDITERKKDEKEIKTLGKAIEQGTVIRRHYGCKWEHRICQQ